MGEYGPRNGGNGALFLALGINGRGWSRAAELEKLVSVMVERQPKVRLLRGVLLSSEHLRCVGCTPGKVRSYVKAPAALRRIEHASSLGKKLERERERAGLKCVS